jgi:crotonobetainyl-CoA:carnitine CoA-transferase CaiB-like acyl-CoA transferase
MTTAKQQDSDGRSGALDGVRVIDFSSVVMGPMATQILGDLGADVIKVEPPQGDLARLVPPRRHPGMGALALNVNRNKRSVALDLKSECGREAFRRLVATADVLVTNMRPGALCRLGLDYPALAALNPRLVYVSATGFRSGSALADRAAYDEIVQASSGMADLMRRKTGRATYAPSILADKVTALAIVYSALAALVHQRATGRGQRVEVPMTDTMVAFNLVEHLAGHTFEPAAGEFGFYRSMAAGHEAVRTKDGWACILPYTSRNVVDFFTRLGLTDAAADPRFVDDRLRPQHFAELYELIASVALERTTAEWESICAELSVPFAPVLDLEHAAEDPYLTEDGLISTAEHPTEGSYRTVGSPVRFFDTPATVRRHCPTVGQHNTELLRELGYAEAAIAQLVEPAAAEGLR